MIIHDLFKNLWIKQTNFLNTWISYIDNLKMNLDLYERQFLRLSYQHSSIYCKSNFIIAWNKIMWVVNFGISNLIPRQGSYKIRTTWKTWESHWILKNFWKSHGVLKKWLEILKSPLFQTLNNYIRIFRWRNGKFSWKSKKNLKALKKKFMNWLKLDEFIYRRN